MSKLADYGTVVLTFMAQQPGEMHSAVEIAEHVHIGLPTVSKVLKILAQQGLVSSSRGAKGGYTLARSAKEITVVQIIDAMEGKVALTECSETKGSCEQESCCSIRVNWQKINQIVRQSLQNVTLDDMSRPATQPITLYTAGSRQRRAFA
jgi:FeS assembly SUF system regulator